MWTVALALSSAGYAQEEICAGPLLVSEWRDAMDAVDEAIGDGNGALAARIVDDAHDVLRCLDVAVRPRDLGRYARQQSVLAFYAQDDIEVTRWAQLASLAIGSAPWDDALVAPDHYHEVVDALAPPGIAGPDDRGLAVPRGGGLLMDGRLLLEPRAAVDVPHLVQTLDRKGRVLDTHWQDGAAFDDDLLGPPDSLEEPSWYEAPPEPARAPAAPRTPRGDGTPEVRFDDAQLERSCPWKGEPRRVEVSGRYITINRKGFPLANDTDERDFVRTLRGCGEFRAARRFLRWREARRRVFVFDGPHHKRRMVDALVTAEPPRRRNRK